MDYLKEYKRQNELLFDKSFEFLKSHKLLGLYYPDCTRKELDLKIAHYSLACQKRDHRIFFTAIITLILFLGIALFSGSFFGLAFLVVLVIYVMFTSKRWHNKKICL